MCAVLEVEILFLQMAVMGLWRMRRASAGVCPLSVGNDCNVPDEHVVVQCRDPES